MKCVRVALNDYSIPDWYGKKREGEKEEGGFSTFLQTFQLSERIMFMAFE